MDCESTEYALALRAREGDTEALAELVERTRVRLFSLAYAELRHYDDAQDAVAAALLQICLHVSELRQPERLRAWMHSIVRNEAHRIRRGSGLSPVSLEEAQEWPGGAEPALLRLDIERALGHLPEDEAEAIRLFYLADLSTRDIARRMGRPEGTVSSWLHRGRRHLAARMEAYAPVAVPNIERAQRAVGPREEGGDKMAWQHFTAKAREFHMFGEGEARQRGGEVGSEHVLYGLVTGGEQGISGKLLLRLGVSLEHVWREIERQGRWGPGTAAEKAVLTQDGKRTIDLAYQSAHELSDYYVGTEHLLLGVVREEHGIGGEILRDLGVGAEDVLREVVLIRLTAMAEAFYKFGAEEVSRRGGTEIGSEHVLYGLVAGGSPENLLERGVSGALLVRLGVSPEHVRKEIERQGRWGAGEAVAKAVLTADGRRVIDLAYEAARDLNSEKRVNYVGTEHLLLGVVREENGIGGKILRDLGVEAEDVLRELPEVAEKLGAIGDATDRLKQAKDDFFAFLARP